MTLHNLKLNPNNPRTITKDKFEKLKKSLKEFPQMLELRPIIYDDNDIVLGGNMRLRALQELEREGLEINDLWFKKASELTEDQKREFIIKDNVPFGEWDEDLLANEWSDLPLDEWGIDTAGWKSNEVVEDEAPEVQEGEAVSKLGEVYQLGRHRLMCGDSTKIEDVEKLMNGQKADMVFTDPPYGVDYASKNEYLNSISPGNRIQTDIENDTMNLEDTSDFVYKLFCQVKNILAERSSYYITAPQGGDLMMMMMMMMKAGIPLRHCLIWVKNNHVLGRTDYNYKHEPILYGWVGVHDFYGNGEHRFSTWEIDKPTKSDLHPTMKPVALIVNAILNSTLQDNIVADLCLGSGTTLIACEQTGRIGYGMEIDPHYCDVIRRRYAKFIGKEDIWQETTPKIQ